MEGDALAEAGDQESLGDEERSDDQPDRGVGEAGEGGELDAGRHPNVGSVIGTIPDGRSFQWCTGTLISPTIFLTAAHCFVGFVGFEFTVSSTRTSMSTSTARSTKASTDSPA